MPGRIQRLFFCGMASYVAASAQNVAFSCHPPLEIKDLTRGQVEDRLAAGSSDFSLYKRLQDLTPITPRPGGLATAFGKKLQQHPDDVRFLYLYGRSLIGKDTRQSISYLNRAVNGSPLFPFTYSALAEIYASRNFRDDVKVMENMRAYRKLCPGNIDAFLYLDKLRDTAETAASARQLRVLLERSATPDDVSYWRALWAAEFRATPAEDFAVLRKRVADDVERLNSRPGLQKRDLLFSLLDGYKLIGQAAAAAKIEQDLGSDQEVVKAYRDWEDKYNMRTRSLTPEARHTAELELARLAAGWIRQWPISSFAWDQYWGTLTLQKDWTKEEMERTGEQMLKLEEFNSMGWNYTPKKLHVAQGWVRHGVRPKDCLAMGEAALDQLLLGPESLNDLTAPPNFAEIAAVRSFGFDYAVWEAMGVIVDAAVQLKDFGKARNMLARMMRWLNENEIKKDDSTTGYMQFEAHYLNFAGRVSEAEGRKLEAVAFYVRATASGWNDPEAMKHAQSMWEEQGGTKEGWNFAVQRLPAPAPKTPRSTITAASEFASWSKEGKALPEMDLQDVSGKAWTLASLRGKTTFVNLWATWCPPCRDELPYVQKLYELVKDRQDIQVITLNLDENPGQLEPFLKEHRFTFPIVMARHYVEDFSGPFSIPQNWLVDRAGTLQQKSVGFDAKIVDWPKQILDRLNQLPK
jgi:thiol-disulfide isomerase/thioredoxin